MHMRRTLSGKYKIDDMDIRIIKILQEDGRISCGQLCKQVFLSKCAVQNRLNGLINAGIIKKFTIEIDRERLEVCDD